MPTDIPQICTPAVITAYCAILSCYSWKNGIKQHAIHFFLNCKYSALQSSLSHYVSIVLEK